MPSSIISMFFHHTKFTVVLLILSCLAPCPAHALEKVSIQLKWLHHYQFAGYYAALEKGFYKEAGLDVTIREGGPDVDVEEVVLSGKADFGVGTSAILLNQAKGQNLVVLAQIFQHSPAVFLTPRKSGIRSVADMKGRRFMYSNQHGDMLAMLKKNGITEQDIVMMPHKGDPRDLLHNKADVMLAYNFNEPFVMEQAGEPYLMFSPVNNGIDFYGDNLFTARKRADQQPDVVAAFRDATIRGWHYALEHKHEVAGLILSQYSKEKSRDWLLYEANQLENIIQPRLIEIGHSNPDRWKHITETFQSLGMLPAQFDFSPIIYAPASHKNYRLLFTTIIVFGVITCLLSAIIMKFKRLNSKLASEIQDRNKVEDALREANLFNDQIINSAQEGIIVYDKNLRYLLWNPFMERIAGYTSSEVIGKQPLDLFPFLKDGGVIQRLEDILKGKTVSPAEFPYFVEKSGLSGYCSDISAPLFDKDGQIIGIIGVVRDTTDRRAAEDLLRENERKLQTIIDATPECIKLIARDGALIMMNRAGLAMLEADDLDQIQGQCIYGIVDEKFQKDFVNLTERVFTGESGGLEFEITGLLGRRLWLETHAVPFRNEQNETIALLGITRNVTERKQAEQALRHSENFLRESQHIGRIGSFDLDIVNDCWTDTAMLDEIFGINDSFRKNISGLLSLVHTDYLEQMQDYLKHIVIGFKQPFDKEYPIVRMNDGEVRWVHGYGKLHFDGNGNPVRMVGAIQDVTERRNMEMERIALEHQILNAQKLESLGVLAGGIAHDFNNILTGILGNISFARSFLDVSHRSSQILMEAEKAAERATGLTHQLLTFAKGSQPIKNITEPKTLLESSAKLVLSGSNVKCDITMPDDLHNFEVDEGQISQAFNNIILNAVQAMRDGGSMSITACNTTLDSSNTLALSAGNYVKISFYDKGTGISEEDQKKIFDPYFTTKAGGNGLGLASVYSIISKHGGHIGVTSMLGVGTTFEIFLPASLEKVAQIAKTTAPAARAAQADHSILVMDDEEMIRDLMSAMLTDLGYHVQTCTNGEEAISFYRDATTSGHTYSVVIMDLTIPGGMGGKEAAQKILEFDPAARLVVSSGYSTDPVMAEYATFGFRAVMTKPYSMLAISNTLNELLT